MRREIQLQLPSLDELTAQAHTVTPAAASRSMNVIHVSVPDRKLKVAGYCRVSTDKEDQESSIRIQQEHFLSESAKHDDWEFVGIYADIVSGSNKEKRPRLQRLLTILASLAEDESHSIADN